MYVISCDLSTVISDGYSTVCYVMAIWAASRRGRRYVAMLQQGDTIKSYISRLLASALSAPSQLASRRPALQAVATEAAEFGTLAASAALAD